MDWVLDILVHRKVKGLICFCAGHTVVSEHLASTFIQSIIQGSLGRPPKTCPVWYLCLKWDLVAFPITPQNHKVSSLRVLYWTYKAAREDPMLNQPNGCPSATNWWESWCCGPGTILLPQSARLSGGKLLNPRVSRLLGWQQKVLGDWTIISQNFLLSSLCLRQWGFTFPHGFAALLLKGRWRKNTFV